MPDADWVNTLKALADQTRLRIVRELLAKSLTVNQITETLGATQYNVSKHLRILKEAGIVELRALGNQREYSIAGVFRKRLSKQGNTLDLGCCVFRFDQLPT